MTLYSFCLVSNLSFLNSTMNNNIHNLDINLLFVHFNFNSQKFYHFDIYNCIALYTDAYFTEKSSDFLIKVKESLLFSNRTKIIS